MNDSRRLLQHFLGVLAYRTQKALRGAPDTFGDFRPAPTARTPYEILWHMSGLMGYARTMLRGGTFEPQRLPTLAAETQRFHDLLAALRQDFENPQLVARITDEQFLQGPLADAMTHVGQLAYLRRLAGAPITPENFIYASVTALNVSADQPLPAAAVIGWQPDQVPRPPGSRHHSANPERVDPDQSHL